MRITSRKSRPKPIVWHKEGDCIRCTHSLGGGGYVQIRRGNWQGPLHRLIMLRRGVSPDRVAMHSCDNRWCINPSHIVAGTQSENMKDAAKKGRLGWWFNGSSSK